MAVKKPGLTVDEVYAGLVKVAGLHGKAFSKQNTTPADRKKLASLYKLALRTVAIRDESKKKIQKHVEKEIIENG